MNNNKIFHKHNKKRNAGLLYEFLVRYICNSLIEENDQNAKKALKLFNKFFKKNTEIHKEFRLINSLATTSVKTDMVASNMLQEAKVYCKTFDEQKLEREKSLLIKEINYKLQDNKFFNRKIPKYKVYATIQNLFNEWKTPRVLNIRKVAEYEESLINWLTEENKNEEYHYKPIEEEYVNNVDALVVKLMTEKLNNKYKDTLNEEQRNIIKEYIFSYDEEKENNEDFVSYLKNLKKGTLKGINEYLLKENKNKMVCKKLKEAKEKIENEDLKNINDDLVERFLKYSQLKQEIIYREENDGDEL